MDINRQMLDAAAQRSVISASQCDALWADLQQQAQHMPGFRPAHVLYYLGGMIAIGAMSLFMTLGWERLGGWGLLAIALVYAALALGMTEYLLQRQRLRLPAGITATLAVVLVPLAVYGLQQALGFWPGDTGRGGAYRDYHRLIDWRWRSTCAAVGRMTSRSGFTCSACSASGAA